MSEAMNIIIAGSRDFDDYRLLKKTVSDYIEENQVNNTQQIRVISGGAKGADRLGECYAFDNGYSVIRFQALWGVYGKFMESLLALDVIMKWQNLHQNQALVR